MKQEGKLTFTGIIMLLIIFYGGFVAVKLISANLMETQIAKEVKEGLSFIRSINLTEEDAIEAVIKILRQHNVIFDEKKKGAISVIINRARGKINYQLTYDVESNLIVTTHRKTYTIKDEISSYR